MNIYNDNVINDIRAIKNSESYKFVRNIYNFKSLFNDSIKKRVVKLREALNKIDEIIDDANNIEEDSERGHDSPKRKFIKELYIMKNSLTHRYYRCQNESIGYLLIDTANVLNE